MSDTRKPLAQVLGASLLTALVLVLPAGPAAAAGPPVHGEGTGALTAPPEITVVRQAASNRTEDRVLRGQVTGALTGTFVQHVTGTVHEHRDFVTFRGTLRFTGTVAGCGDDEHTLTLGLTGRGDTSQPGNPVTVSTVRVLRQPDSTLHVTGSGVVEQDGPFMSYRVSYVCR
jgi:hypothetical protein